MKEIGTFRMRRPVRVPIGSVAILCLATALFFLWEEHRAHLLGKLPIRAYDRWPLVIIDSAVFIIFAFSFFKPNTRRDWRALGGFSVFIVALFVEMYGFHSQGCADISGAGRFVWSS